VVSTDELAGVAYLKIGEAEHGLPARKLESLQGGFARLLECDAQQETCSM